MNINSFIITFTGFSVASLKFALKLRVDNYFPRAVSATFHINIRYNNGENVD